MDIERHIRLFNAAVTSGNWSEFVELFADDAVLEFVGPPVGPFAGRAAIRQAYESNPPDDTISTAGDLVHRDGATVVPYRWDATGSTGTMRFTGATDGSIQRLAVTFD